MNCVCAHSDCAGAHDHTCSLQGDLLGDAKYLYWYSGDILVDETFKDFADTVCSNFDHQYPPVSHEDAVLELSAFFWKIGSSQREH